jgi:hypothetical protein
MLLKYSRLRLPLYAQLEIFKNQILSNRIGDEKSVCDNEDMNSLVERMLRLLDDREWEVWASASQDLWADKKREMFPDIHGLYNLVCFSLRYKITLICCDFARYYVYMTYETVE